MFKSRGQDKLNKPPFLSLLETRKKNAPVSDNIIDFCDIKIHQVPSFLSPYCSIKANLSRALNTRMS